MPRRFRNEKPIKKDQQGAREAREELHEVIRSTERKPLVQKPNRDVARGDWDRTGDHHDADITIDEE